MNAKLIEITDIKHHKHLTSKPQLGWTITLNNGDNAVVIRTVNSGYLVGIIPVEEG